MKAVKYEYWVCSSCGADYDTEEEAEACCAEELEEENEEEE